ncbi:MJ1477/TM1410 family putative glycoside hydrolase [Deinococcus sp. PEB2-67]
MRQARVTRAPWSALLLLSACAAPPAQAGQDPAPSPLPSPAPRALKDARTWGYQLTGYGADRLTRVAASTFDVIVVDTLDDDTRPWPAPEVAQAARTHVLLGYLSVGAAEAYRPYWQPGWRPGTPAWLLSEQPDWPGNYDVAYWDADWQALTLRELDRVIDQGFHGTYLDLIDAYEQHPDRPAARAEMVAWVCRLAAHARARRAGFLIVPQNAAELIRDPRYAPCVDALGSEETFVYATNQPTEAARRDALLADYALWKAAGKPVFTVDYADQPDLTTRTYAQARAQGLIPYVTVREADRLTPGQ